MADETSVRHQGRIFVDEGYIPSEMSSSPPANKKRQNSRGLNPKSFTHTEAASLSQLNETLMQELSAMHMERHHLVVKIDQLEDELHTMDLKNEALMLEIREVGGTFQVVSEQASEMEEELRQQRLRNNRELASVLQSAQEAEKEKTESLVRSIEKLSRELEQVTAEQELGDERGDPGKRTMEQELQRFKDAVEAAKLKMRSTAKLLEELRESNRDLEAASSTYQLQLHMELEEHEFRIADKISGLNKEIRSMAEFEAKPSDLSGAEETCRDLEPGAQLDKDCSRLRDSVRKLLGAMKEKQLQISKLENQLFATGDNKKALELQVRRLSTASFEVSKQAKEEVTRMKQRVGELSEALEKSESGMVQLRAELDAARRKVRRKPHTVTDLYGLPILAASTSMAVAGMCFYLSSRRH